jgi:predicted MFS family arabinose efflux permease
MRPRLGLLATRDFRLLWTGETASFLGTSIGELAIPLVALSVLHAGAFAISALMAAAWLPWLVIGLPAGAWVDRLPRRNVMIAADLLSLAAFVSVPIAAWCGVLTIAQLLVVALAGGIASVFFTTAFRAFIPTLLNRDDLLEGNAKLSGSEQVANVAGPGVAGLLAQVAGAATGVLANAVSFAVSALCLSRLQVRESSPAEVRQRHLLREIAEGLRLVAGDPLLRANTLFGCLSNLVLAGYQAVLVVFLVKVVGLSSGATGVMIALISLGGVSGALVARWAAKTFGSARAVFYGRLLLTPAGLLIPLTSRGPGLVLFVLGSVMIDAVLIVGNIIWASWAQGYYPAQMRGRVSTSISVFAYGVAPVGALLAGLIASQAGARTALWVMLGVLALSSLVQLAGPLPRLRDLPAAAHSQPAQPAQPAQGSEVSSREMMQSEKG